MAIFTTTIVACLFLQLAGGENLYWKPNSNWGGPSNWALGRVPGCKDRASLSSVPANSVIYVDSDVTVQSISLPANGRLVLSPSVTIRLSAEEDCTVPGDTEPMVATVENEFVGASNQYWECGSNWLTEENLPADHAPCGDDRAIFDTESSFSFVTANDSIFVRSLTIRGQEIQSQTDITSPEFNLRSIKIDSNCATDPTQCPCPNDAFCPKAGKPGGLRESNVGGIVGGIVVAVLVLVAVAVLVILALFLYTRRRQTVNYVKDELLDESELGSSSPPPSSSTPDLEGDKKLFDNPLFEETKVDLGSEAGKVPLEDVPGVGMTAEYEAGPSLSANGAGNREGAGKKAPKLDKYERFF